MPESIAGGSYTNNLDNAILYKAFGYYYDTKEDYYKAINYYKKALSMYESTLEKSSELDLDAFNNLIKLNKKIGNFEKAEEIRLTLKEIREKKSFEDNIKNRIVIKKITINKTQIFEKINWELTPNINILLGKNGYGKSYLFKLIVSLIQKNNKKIKDILKESLDVTIASCYVQKKDQIHEIIWSKQYFEKSIGKIPVLAIPDIRFVDKSKDTIELRGGNQNSNILEFGAEHFIEDIKNEDQLHDLYYKLCILYLNNNKSFEHELFSLMQNAITELTGISFVFSHVEIINDFFLKLYVEIDKMLTIPIQKISQGTLSILSIIGLVYYFLKSLRKEKELRHKGNCIVFIDEIDAHLHPEWQQKIVPLLRDLFPNVQFFLTAHSPLITAGCYENEVSILRKNKNKQYTLFQCSNDFIGWTAEEIYKNIFEIEDLDNTFLFYSGLSPFKKEIENKINNLEKKGSLSVVDSNQLNKLYNDLDYIEKAEKKSNERAKILDLQRQNRNLKLELKKANIK